MSSKFYASIIAENEQEIENSALKKASKALAIYYGTFSSKKRPIPPDYNNPAYCCAYLYKYATIHTGMVTKYFRKMFRKKEVKKILNINRNIKICCLGGGPGMGIVGIFKALAICPHFYQKVAKVSVLDACVGWEASFNSIMSDLIDGKDEQVSITRKFKKEFIQVDLQDPLPAKVRKVISEADVICMMKFVSELSIDKSSCILKVIGELFKNKALILYIDNFKRDTFESVDFISTSPDFKVVLGPLEDEKFVRQSSSDVVTYGCKPRTYDRISVIGWMKTPNESVNASDGWLSASGSINVYDARLSSKESINVYDAELSSNESINEYDASLSAKESINVYDAEFSSNESIKEYDASLSAKESINVYDAELSSNESINVYDAGLSSKEESINEYDASLSAKESINVYDASLSASYSSLSDISIGTESEIKDSDILTNLDEEWEVISCNKYTQTEQDYFSNSFRNEMFPCTDEVELVALMASINATSSTSSVHADLLTLMGRFILKKKMQGEKFCCRHA